MKRKRGDEEDDPTQHHAMKRVRYSNDKKQVGFTTLPCSTGSKTYKMSHRATTYRCTKCVGCGFYEGGYLEQCAACGRCAQCMVNCFCKGRVIADKKDKLPLLMKRRMDRAIWTAFKTGDFDPICGLIVTQADVNLLDYQRQTGETALMAAMYHGNEEMAAFLLGHGADASIRIRQSGMDATSFAGMKKERSKAYNYERN